MLNHLILLNCNAKYEDSTSYVYKFFMNVVLLIWRLSLIIAYVDILLILIVILHSEEQCEKL